MGDDVEVEWEGDRITRAWWTRDGHRVELIEIASGSNSLSVCLVDSETADAVYPPDPAADIEELRQLLASKTLERAAQDLRAVSRSLTKDAGRWEKSDRDDLWALADPFLDLAFAQYELWKIGSDLRVVAARALGERFGSAQEVASAAFFVSTGSSRFFADHRLYDWNDKVTAVANIIEELTGIPVETLKDFLAGDLFELATLIKKLAEAAKNKAGAEYKRLKKAMGELLEAIFNKLISKKFREWLAKKLGAEAAEKLIEKFAEKLLPIIGWLAVGIEFVALMWIWWEILLDP